jgi:hypothetical protein
MAWVQLHDLAPQPRPGYAHSAALGEMQIQNEQHGEQAAAIIQEPIADPAAVIQPDRIAGGGLNGGWKSRRRHQVVDGLRTEQPDDGFGK